MNHEVGLYRNNDSSSYPYEFYCCASRLGAHVFTQAGSLGDKIPTDQLLPLRDRKADVAYEEI